MPLLFVIAFAVGICGGETAFAAAGRVAFDSQNASFTFNSHPEFKGARGAAEQDGDLWRIRYDFSGGGHGVGFVVKPNSPFMADRIVFEAMHGHGHSMAVVVRDSTGQAFLKKTTPAPFQWCRYVCRLDGYWDGHWSGANDGVLHQPVVSFEINLDRSVKGLPVADDVGTVLMRRIGAETDEASALAPLIRYTITDFAPGDRFSAGPRAFFRSDQPGMPLVNGDLEIDFSRHAQVDLRNEIPVWGSPKDFLLSVEAPAEAAGLEFELGLRTGDAAEGHARGFSLGALPAAAAGRSVIRATLSVAAPERMGRSRRVMRLLVRRGKAPAKKMRLRLLRLEAAVRAGADLPPLLATPPSGDEPPRKLTVSFLNLQSAACENGTVRVSMRDWNGRELGVATARLPRTVPGVRAVAQVALPSVGKGLNFVSYDCTLLRDGLADETIRGWTTSWTRPLGKDAETGKRPDLPWGFGLYLHRSEDFICYSSGYAVENDAAALARMEKKAALAQVMGVKWERVEFLPNMICRDKGKFDFAFYDRLVDCAERHGISMYGLFSHYWPMRGSKRADQHDRSAYTPENYTNWVETLRRTAERYRGRIAGWEIWNEPNISMYWEGPREDYVKLLNLAYPAVKEADPAARVLACSIAGTDLAFIDMCIGAKAKFDDITLHPYRGEPDERNFMSELVAVTNRSHGTKTWLTELGWPTGCDCRTYSERQQAGYFARAYMAAAGSGCCAAINGYDFFDDGFNVLERENNFGIVRRDGTPKPACRALAKVFRTFTDGTPSIVPHKQADGSTVWIFRMGGRAAVWCDREAALRVRTKECAEASNLMDEPLGTGCVQEVRVGPTAPVFFACEVSGIEVLPKAESVDAGRIVTNEF